MAGSWVSTSVTSASIISWPGGYRDRHAVVTVLDEVQAADAVHLDRRDHRAAPVSLIEQLPPLPVAVRDGPEPTVEVARLLDRPDHRIRPDGPQAQIELAAEAQRADHLAERRGENAAWGA